MKKITKATVDKAICTGKGQRIIWNTESYRSRKVEGFMTFFNHFTSLLSDARF